MLNDLTDERKQSLSHQIQFAFSPGAPINRYELFAGRLKQVQDVLYAIAQRGHHGIVYGERGVGKTSLVTVLDEILRRTNVGEYVTARINCDVADNFSSLWFKILDEFSISQEVRRIGFLEEKETSQLRFEQILPDAVLPNDIRKALASLRKKTIIIVDEYDRMNDSQSSKLMADTLKVFSDYSQDVTIILVGIADSVDGLISDHESVERSLVQIHMPRMSIDEMRGILTKSLKTVEMTIDPHAADYTCRLSLGLPHYVHLIGLHAAQAAVQDNRLAVLTRDVIAATQQAVARAQQSVQNAYHTAISSPRSGNTLESALLACALAPTDEMGFFVANKARRQLDILLQTTSELSTLTRHMHRFCEEERGPILVRKGELHRYRFRFRNPLLQPFILLKALADRRLTAEAISAMGSPDNED